METTNIIVVNFTKKTLYAFFFLYIILLFSNCRNKEETNITSVKIDTDNPSSLNISLSKEVIKSINFTTFATLIGNIEKIELFNDLVIIYDGEFRLFNIASNKIITLANKGSGPNEYLSITGIKATNSGVYYTDRRKKTFNKVSFDGSPIFEIDINSNPCDFSILNDTLVAFFHGSFPLQGQNFRISIFDINRKSHCSLNIPYPKKHWNFLHFDDWNNFSEHNGNIMLSFSGSNRVYSYNSANNTFSPFVDFDFGEKSLTNDILNKDYDEIFNFANIIDEKQIFCRVLSSFETNGFFIFTTRVGSIWYIYTYNKITNKTNIFNSININKSLSLDVNFDLMPKGYYNGDLLFILEPINLMNTPKLMSLLNSYNIINSETISSTSNPIIILINEKSFLLN
jgi:hypothetical protein